MTIGSLFRTLFCMPSNLYDIPFDFHARHFRCLFHSEGHSVMNNWTPVAFLMFLCVNNTLPVSAYDESGSHFYYIETLKSKWNQNWPCLLCHCTFLVFFLHESQKIPSLITCSSFLLFLTPPFELPGHFWNMPNFCNILIFIQITAHCYNW